MIDWLENLIGCPKPNLGWTCSKGWHHRGRCKIHRSWWNILSLNSN